MYFAKAAPRECSEENSFEKYSEWNNRELFKIKCNLSKSFEETVLKSVFIVNIYNNIKIVQKSCKDLMSFAKNL